MSVLVHPAIEFLTTLAPQPEARFNIEHYADVPKGTVKPRPDRLMGRHADLTPQDVQELLPELDRINQLGGGIFIARNQCHGHRAEKNVHRVLGLHADFDGISDVELDRLSNHLLPSIVVRTSKPGHYQLYWQLANGEALEKEEAKKLNQVLVKFGADPAAVDVSRLLRLPGFKHMKYRHDGSTPTVTAEYTGVVYTSTQLRMAFGTEVSDKGLNPNHYVQVRHNGLNHSVPEPVIESISDRIQSRLPTLWRGDWAAAPRRDGTSGYPSASEADLALAGHIVREARRGLIDESLLPGVVEGVFNRSGLGLSEKWQARDDYRAATIKRAMSLPPSLLVQPDDPFLLDSHGDIRNAKAFSSIARDKFIQITTRGKWLRWEDDRWLLCEKQEEQALAKDVCRQILDSAQAVFLKDQERGKRLVNEAMSSHRLNRIQAMLTLAISEPGMAATDKELDANPHYLGVDNGVVNLKDGQLLSNQPEFRITRYCNASYDENASCQRWQQFLSEIFQDDIETISCVQRLLGCTLLGLSNEEILVICYGHGSNGKSVFSNVIHKIMGGYSMTAPPSLLTVRKNGDAGPRNDLAALAGARYVSINELQAGDRLDEQVVKLLAGREPISARFLHQEFFEFEPTFTPWLRTNHKPIVTGDEDGIWRRLILLPFTTKFSEGKQDPYLEDKLLAEKDGILMWMLAGVTRYLEDGLKLSRRIKAELNRYRTESDLLGEFLAEMTTNDPTKKVSQGALFSRYRYWCQDSGVRPSSKKSFTQRLAERGYAEGKSGVNRYYLGLDMRPTMFCTGVDGVDRIDKDLDLSATFESHEEKPCNQETTRPSCPPSAVEVTNA